MDMGSIGKNIRKCRLMRKYRQEYLAEKSGISPNYLSSIERGLKVPSVETLINIINALDVSADMIFCDTIHASYEVKHSILHEKIEKLSNEDRTRIYDVIDILIKHSRQVKP